MLAKISIQGIYVVTMDMMVAEHGQDKADDFIQFLEERSFAVLHGISLYDYDDYKEWYMQNQK